MGSQERMRYHDFAPMLSSTVYDLSGKMKEIKDLKHYVLPSPPMMPPLTYSLP
jgi:hypothetical protein